MEAIKGLNVELRFLLELCVLAALGIPIIKLGELEVDILHRHVRSRAGELHLTSLEQSLL
jgi:hypothetical protein